MMHHTETAKEVIRLQKKWLTATSEFKLTKEYSELYGRISNLREQLSPAELANITQEIDWWVTAIIHDKNGGANE